MHPLAALVIHWRGHTCFLLTTAGGGHILIDPPSPSVGYHVATHSIPVRFVFVSRNHPDHDSVEAAQGTRTASHRTPALNPDLRAKLAPPDAFLTAMRGKAEVVHVRDRDLWLSPTTLPKRPTIYLLRYE